jgi:hypothetical protein
MATRLVQILTFTDVADGATVAQAHDININGTATTPDYLAGDVAGFGITADATNVSVTNNSGAQATIRVWVKREHSVERALGSTSATLSPVPFAASTGSAGSGGGDPAVIFDDAVAADKVNIRSDRASDQSPIDNTQAGITNLGSNTGGAAPGATANYSTIGGGDDNAATDEYATVAGGYGNTASGDGASIPGGYDNVASGSAAFATGDGAQASGAAAHAVGRNTVAQGDYSHAEGQSSQATANYAHAEGLSTTASNQTAHAEGNGTTASGSASHAEGQTTQATATGAHAEGVGTLASGQRSHAEGDSTVASGYASHAEGGSNTASASFSSATGVRARATNDGERAHASGRFLADGDAQSTMIVMKLGPSNAPIAATSLNFGDGGGSTAIALVDDRAYTVTVTAVAGGGAAGAISAAIQRQFIVRTTAGSTVLIASGAQSIIGHATPVAQWTITANPTGGLGLQIQFATGADAATANVSVVARVQLECCPVTP